MKSLNSILLTALGLALSTLVAQSANIEISSLPFAITAPGTYVVTGNLSSSEIRNVAAITISTSISGPVILDLKGFTLTGDGGDSLGIGIGLFAGINVSNTSPITIRNGTLANFAFGVWAGAAGQFPVLSDITVNNMTINLGHSQSAGAGVLFSAVISSTISNCSFHGGSYGIEDTFSGGGNRYINDTFVNTNPLFVTSQNGGIPTVLNHCQFDESPAN